MKIAIPRTIWILGLASLLTDVSTEMIHSVLPLFLVTSLGTSITIVGSIEGLAEATASILKVFSGALSDFLGHRKWVIVGGYGFSTLVKPLFALATSPMSVLIARMGDRIGKGIRVAPRDALVADCTDETNRGAAYGLRQSLDTIGAIIGPIAATVILLGSQHNIRSIFWLAIIPAVAAVILLALGINEPKYPQSKAAVNPISIKPLGSLGKRYWALVLVALLFNLGNSSDAFLLLRAQDIGISPPFIPLVLVVMNISYALSSYPAGRLSDKIGRYGMLVTSFALYAAVYLGLAFTHHPWQFWILLSVYGLHLGLSQGNLLALVADCVPKELRGTAFGALSLVVGGALLPASLLAGALWQYISPGAAFAAGSLFAIMALMLFVSTVKPHRQTKTTVK